MCTFVREMVFLTIAPFVIWKLYSTILWCKCDFDSLFTPTLNDCLEDHILHISVLINSVYGLDIKYYIKLQTGWQRPYTVKIRLTLDLCRQYVVKCSRYQPWFMSCTPSKASAWSLSAAMREASSWLHTAWFTCLTAAWTANRKKSWIFWHARTAVRVFETAVSCTFEYKSTECFKKKKVDAAAFMIMEAGSSLLLTKSMQLWISCCVSNSS